MCIRDRTETEAGMMAILIISLAALTAAGIVLQHLASRYMTLELRGDERRITRD
jgi:hypothetical protein